jgi:hypothetical protein
MHMCIQRAAEALHEAHRPQPAARAPAALTQPRFDDPQKDVQHRAERLGIALQEIAQPFGHRQYPLTHRQRGKDLVGQMRRHLGHVPCVAGGTQRAALARKRDQEIVSAVPAAGTRETVSQDAAFEVAAKLPLHIRRHAPALPLLGLRQVGLEMALNRAVQRRVLGAAATIHGARARSVDGGVHAATAAYAYGPNRLLDIITVMRGRSMD